MNEVTPADHIALRSDYIAPSPEPVEPALSIRKIATRVGRSEAAVRKWLRNPRWPFGQGPFSPELVPKIEAWAAGLRRPHVAGVGRLASAAELEAWRVVQIKRLAARLEGMDLQQREQALTAWVADHLASAHLNT